MYELSFQQIMEIADKAAERAVEKYRANEKPLVFRTKTNVARYLDCNRKTVDAMIERDQIIITPCGGYKLNQNYRK